MISTDSRPANTATHTALADHTRTVELIRKFALAYLPQIPADEYPYLNGMSQKVISGHHDGLHELQFGLDLILDGLERLQRGQ